MKTYTTTVEEINGELVVNIPIELMNEMGWVDGTTLEFEIEDGGVFISEKKEWTTDELLEGDNFKRLLDNVSRYKNVYYILHKGQTLCLAPYNEDDLLGEGVDYDFNRFDDHGKVEFKTILDKLKRDATI